MEISSVVIILFYTCAYLVGMFYLLAGERLGKSDDLWGPFFMLIGIFCLLIVSRKIAHIIYSIVDNKYLILVIVIFLLAITARHAVSLYKKNSFILKSEALDNVFL